MQARVPSGMESDQLFVNGERQHMARYPNFDPAAQYFDGWAADAFSKERAARWADPSGGFIHAIHPNRVRRRGRGWTAAGFEVLEANPIPT